MVVIVTSRVRSLHDPTQQDYIHARTLPICSEDPSRVHYAK